jgi:hypothetical protein
MGGCGKTKSPIIGLFFYTSLFNLSRMLRPFDPGLGVNIHALHKHQLNYFTVPLGRFSKTSPLPMYSFSFLWIFRGVKGDISVFLDII